MNYIGIDIHAIHDPFGGYQAKVMVNLPTSDAYPTLLLAMNAN